MVSGKALFWMILIAAVAIIHIFFFSNTGAAIRPSSNSFDKDNYHIDNQPLPLYNDKNLITRTEFCLKNYLFEIIQETRTATTTFLHKGNYIKSTSHYTHYEIINRYDSSMIPVRCENNTDPAELYSKGITQLEKVCINNDIYWNVKIDYKTFVRPAFDKCI